MCYKSGEYYRFHAPPDIPSSKSVAPTVEKELEKPLENGSELQEDTGDGLTVPTKFSLFERAGEAKTSLDRKPRTDIAAFENGDRSPRENRDMVKILAILKDSHVLRFAMAAPDRTVFFQEVTAMLHKGSYFLEWMKVKH
ncbi:hypothetical protein APTSU1_001076800 [Apodemus speciosus]|uniref:Uncharacterized protein n=1 Tax=Apodemus speciosus TaxID=105296 RepID=A0ABQ0F8F5_APOSI